MSFKEDKIGDICSKLMKYALLNLQKMSDLDLTANIINL